MRHASHIALALIAVLAGCSTGDHIDCNCWQNEAPVVWLAAGPAEGSINPSPVDFFWGGWDPDGDITRYEYVFNANAGGVFNPIDTVGVDWIPVLGSDSSFTLAGGDSSAPQSYTFFIRAVDRYRLRSDSAHRSFYIVE